MTPDVPTTVLLVDDEQNILSALERGLRGEGFRIVTTSDPTQAMDMIRREKVDILVSDIQMPRLSGLQLVSLVRRAFPDVIRILLTGTGTLDAAMAAINEGEVYRFIAKPWEPQALRETLRGAAERASELRELSTAAGSAERRALLLADLEREHPGISRVERTDGVYVLEREPLLKDAARLHSPELRALISVEK